MFILANRLFEAGLSVSSAYGLNFFHYLKHLLLEANRNPGWLVVIGFALLATGLLGRFARGQLAHRHVQPRELRPSKSRI